MKRFWLVALFIANGLVGNAQTYHPFPTDSATWSQIMYNWGQFGQECWWTKHYGLAGDTVINAQQYSKLYGINHYNGNYKDVDHFTLDSAKYVGAIREDSIKKIYYLTADSSIEILLYDFGLEIGDTFYNVTPWYDTIQMELSSTDSVELYDGTVRKKYYLTGGAVWIEGVGNAIGWFELVWIGTFDPWLICFSHNGQHMFNLDGDTSYCSCTPAWWDAIETLSSDKIKVFPNPVSEKLTIQTPTSINVASIYNALGQRVFQSQAIQQNQMTIDVSTLPNGLYYITLNGPESSYRQTFVKQ